MYIPVILGTSRKGRQSKKVAEAVCRGITERGSETALLDVRDYAPTATDNTKENDNSRKFSEKISRADALVIVSPEYNHSFPGELKMTLDMLFEEYAGKTAWLCGVSSGQMGGARAVEQLKLLCVSLGMKPVNEALYFPFVQKVFNEKGDLENEEQLARLKKFVEKVCGR